MSFQEDNNTSDYLNHNISLLGNKLLCHIAIIADTLPNAENHLDWKQISKNDVISFFENSDEEVNIALADLFSSGFIIYKSRDILVTDMGLAAARCARYIY